MDATQMICDSILESDEEENERGQPLAKLCILKNEHIPETELPLFLGDNVLGRDPNTCTLPLPAPSISKQHATICVSVYRRRGCHGEVDVEALVWDLGSMNGTHKGRLKLTPNVRYALSERDSLVVADIPCQYVTCAVDTVPSQGDMRTPVSRNSGVKAPLPDASGEKGGDTITGSKKCVNGGTKTRVSSPDQEDTRKTPVRTSCLSFEKTPTQPQGTLVPESGSDSDGEIGDRRRKALVSDSDSYKQSPTCSTFLSPQNKIVPESEDESPITPSSSTKNRPYRHVGFGKEETDLDVGRQQPMKKKALAVVDDSEEEEEREEERAALRGRKSEESGQHVPVKQECNVSLTGEDELPVSTPSVFTDAVPAFDMDSDTDIEEEGVASTGPVTMNTNQQADQPPDTAQLHMDSDTDVDEDDYAPDKVPKSVPSSADHTNPPHVISVIRPEGITMDSDTDVDDDDAAVSDAATKAKPTSIQSTHTADSAPSTQLKDFHLDSDTDVDEEEEKKRGTNNMCPKIDKTPTRLDIMPLGPESIPPAPHSLHPDSDTDDEAIPAPAISEPSMVSAVTESCTAADAGAALGILSDSDTDVEDGSPLVIPVAVPTSSVGPGTTSEARKSESEADTDVNPDDLRVDSDTGVEDEKVDFGEAGEVQIPNLPRENTPGFLVPLKQNCSTPIQVSEGEVEDMETQAFLSPSTGPFRHAVAPAVRPIPLSTVSDSQEDEEFVVAETQSFVLQTRDCQANPPEDPTQAFGLDSSGDEQGEQSIRGGSFQLGSSDSNHLQAQGQAQALAMESTQAFVSVVGGVNLEDTQEYAAVSNADRTSMQNDSNLEATQAYGENEEPARCSVMSAQEGQLDLALEATQAYLLEPSSDSEDETDEDERKNTATAETQAFYFPTSSTLAMAETQPMSAFEEEESLDKENPISSVLEVKPTPQNGTDERQEHGEAAQRQKSHLSEALSLAETQPMRISDDEESDDEDLIPGPRIRKAKPLQLGEDQTQTLPNSELSAVETQPMGICDSEQSDEDSSPGPRKRAARPQQIQEEETQPLTNSESSTDETQPLEIKTGLQPQRRKGRQSEAGTSGTTIRGTRGTRARLREAEEQAECPEPPKRQTRGKNKALPTTRGRRRKPRPDEEESEEEEEVVQAKGAGGTTREQKDNEDKEERLETERNKHTEKAKLMKKQEERREAKLEREKKEKEEKERLQANISERLRLERERAEKDRIDSERKEQEEKERLEREKAEREEKERLERKERIEKEREEQEEQERLQAVIAERLKLERERAEKDRIDRERKEQEEKKRADKAQKEKEEQLGRERKEKEEKERLEHEKAQREEKERFKREKTEREEKERLEKEKAEREEREKRERIEKRKEQGEKESLQRAKREQEERLKRERKEQEHQARLERDTTEREERERLEKEKQEKEQEENKPKTPARSRRATRTTGAPCTTEPEQGSTVSANDDVPARRTRSRSNSSNSVSSERSASSVNTQGSRGRGRGRGAKGTSGPPQATIVRSSNRRRTVAAEATRVTSNDVPPQGVLSRSNSTNSLNSEISSCSMSSQGRGRGGRQRGRGRKTEAEPCSIPPVNSQSEPNLAPKPTARGRKSRKAEESSNEVPHEDENEKADSQQASTTRGRQRANENRSEPAAADEQGPSNQEERCASEDSPLPKRNVRGRGQKAVKSETVEAPVAPAISDGDEAKDKRKGRKRELQANKEDDSSSSSKVSKGKEKAQTPEAAEEEANGETKDDIPVQAKRRGRASSAQAKNTKDSPTEGQVKEESEKMEEETVERRGKGQPSMVQKKKKEEQGESGTSVEQDPHVEAPGPQTPTSSGSRKRRAPVDSSPVAKTPRSSSASPAASGRLRAASQDYKVLFTGVVDEGGERVLARLGGSMAKGVADMNCLVTDKVRRTVKFLCAVAKGVPIVTTYWLEKSGKAGSFLSPNAFVVKDLEQEKKFSFCLQESLRIASSQSLLQGYEIHVTKSVKPEPVHMKDIISCSGATFLPKMPSSHKPQTVVISCEEDWLLCGSALSVSLPVVTAEFILTGILQQKVDLQTHTLSAPRNTLQPAGGRGRGRKKT